MRSLKAIISLQDADDMDEGDDQLADEIDDLVMRMSTKRRRNQ